MTSRPPPFVYFLTGRLQKDSMTADCSLHHVLAPVDSRGGCEPAGDERHTGAQLKDSGRKKKKKNLGTRSHLIIHWTAEKQAMMGGPPTMLGTSQVRSTALSSGMVVLSEQSHDLVGNGVKRSHLFLFCFWVNKWQHPLVPCYCFCFGSN